MTCSPRHEYFDSVMSPEADFDSVTQEASNLISRSRATCLWFIREDYTPGGTALISLLEKIQRYGDRNSYVQARRFKEWLLLNSSAKFSG